MDDNRRVERNMITCRRRISKHTGSVGDNTEIKKKMSTTRFATVKVDGAVLGQRASVKTFVVTNKTTIGDLLTMVLNGFSAICEDKELFYMAIESVDDNTGEQSSGDKKRVVRLQNADIVLEIQTSYPAKQHRFVLHVKSDTGVLTVHDKAIKPQTPTCSVFMKESATCRHLIQLMLDVYKVKATPEQYVLFEVDLASKVTHQLELCNRPLTIQSQWLDPHESYFEVRRADDLSATKDKIRRSHSLEEIGQCKRLLNIREIRKTLVQKRSDCVKAAARRPNHVTQPRDVTLAKVRESLIGLRSQFSAIKGNQSEHLSTDSGKSTPSSKASSGEGSGRRSGQRGRSLEVNKRRTRSLSRDKSGDANSQKSGSVFGQHTLERARQRQRRRRNSEQDTSSNPDPGGNSKVEKPKRSTSLDNVSAWERRKLYDNNRKLTESGSDITSESGHRSDMDAKQRHLAANTKNTCSGVIGKTRSRRTLPNVPNHVINGNIAERKRRVSEKVLDMKSGAAPDFRIGDDDLNVDSIENSVTRPDSETTSDNSHQMALNDDVVFQPVDPPDDIATDSLSRNSDFRNAPKPEKAHRTNHVTDVKRDHETDSPVCRAPIRTKTLNGIELPKPVPKLASALGDRLPVTRSSPCDTKRNCKPLTLHRLIRSCDLCHVTLRLKSGSKCTSDTLKLMTSSFEYNDSDNTYCPRGKIPLLGQNGSAFVAVGQLNTSELTMTSSVIIVDEVDESAFVEVEGHLMSGDYLVEFNGVNMLSLTLPQAVAMVTECDVTSSLELVVGRRRQIQIPRYCDVSDDVETLKSQLNLLHQEVDKYRSHVIELKQALQSRDSTIHGLELDQSAHKQQMADIIQSKENNTLNGSSPWKQENTGRNGSAAKIETETNQRQVKLAQLKHILRHDNSVFGLSINDNVGYLDYDYDGMHVSAV